MLQLAMDFSEKSFDYNEARALTTYLETQTANLIPDPQDTGIHIGKIYLELPIRRQKRQIAPAGASGEVFHKAVQGVHTQTAGAFL